MTRKSHAMWAALLTVSVLSSPAWAQLDRLKKFASGSSEPAAKKIAHFKLKGLLAETPVEMPPLFASEPPLSLKALLERLKQARMDDKVVAVVIDLEQAALGVAQLEEFHASLQKFGAVDKPVYVHADQLMTMSYAAASGASHISITPTGEVWLMGFHSETPYLRGGLEKLGIVPDFEQCGDFKTGAESITRTGPSEQSKEMMNWLFDGLYDSVVNTIGTGRGMKPKQVRGLIDGGPYSAEEALAAGLIDSVMYRQDFAADMKDRYGKNIEVVRDYGSESASDVPDNMFAAFEFFMKMFNPSPKVYTEPSVAIVYVEGMILTGQAEQSPFGSSSGAYSTTLRRAFDKAAEDDSVKAVVMRVDSGGGSALASEIILNASRRVAKKKPLIVSMGNVAGSGGYYVTCASDTIFADAGTITSSIGVLSGKLVTTGFWDKLGINWYPHQRGEMAGLLSTSTPFSDAERAKMRKYMEEVYGIFKDHVVKARGDKLKKPIGELAGGRVFTGAQALELGLIDKIGGLNDAIKFAANEARLGEYETRVIPEPPNIFDMFMGGADDDEVLGIAARTNSLSLINLPPFKTALPMLAKLEPLRFRAVLRQLQKIELLHRENVLTVMPDELVIR